LLFSFSLLPYLFQQALHPAHFFVQHLLEAGPSLLCSDTAILCVPATLRVSCRASSFRLYRVPITAHGADKHSL
jgi:hypothetical protein